MGPWSQTSLQVNSENIIQALQTTAPKNPDLIYIIESEEDLVESQKQ